MHSYALQAFPKQSQSPSCVNALWWEKHVQMPMTLDIHNIWVWPSPFSKTIHIFTMHKFRFKHSVSPAHNSPKQLNKLVSACRPLKYTNSSYSHVCITITNIYILQARLVSIYQQCLGLSLCSASKRLLFEVSIMIEQYICAVQCNAVQCSAVQCSAVQCSAVQCSAVQCSAVQCSAVLWCGVVWCGVVCCAVLCCAVLCCAVLCCAVLCCAVLCCAVLCCAVLCCAVLCCAVLCCAVLCCAVLCCAVLCCAVLCCAVLCCAVLCCGFHLGDLIMNDCSIYTAMYNLHRIEAAIVPIIANKAINMIMPPTTSMSTPSFSMSCIFVGGLGSLLVVVGNMRLVFHLTPRSGMRRRAERLSEYKARPEENNAKPIIWNITGPRLFAFLTNNMNMLFLFKWTINLTIHVVYTHAPIPIHIYSRRYRN